MSPTPHEIISALIAHVERLRFIHESAARANHNAEADTYEGFQYRAIHSAHGSGATWALDDVLEILRESLSDPAGLLSRPFSPHRGETLDYYNEADCGEMSIDDWANSLPQADTSL